MKYFILLPLLLVFACTHQPAPVELVNPFIGTGAHGHNFPGATVPFSLMQVSPDTRLTWGGYGIQHFWIMHN